MEIEKPNGESYNEDVTLNRRKFIKLKRIKKAREREGDSLSMEDTMQLLMLDDWLAQNNTDWNRNYPESKYLDELLEALEYYQDN